MPAQPVQKADRQGKDWYSVSVETLQSWGLLLLLLALAGLGFYFYRLFDRSSLGEEAAAMIGQAEALRQQLSNEPRVATGFAAEYEDGTQSLKEAKARLEARDLGAARDRARHSREALQSIVDALALRGGAGQAQFVSLQGDVEFRRGEGGDWQEARSRVQLQGGDTVRTAENGSAVVMLQDGTLYTVQPNTQLVVSPRSGGAGGGPEQAIEMKYGWVNLSTSQSTGSNVKTPGAVARVKESSEAYVAVDKGTSQGRFGAYRGGMELASNGGLTRQVSALQQVVQTGGLLSEPKAMPGKPEPVEPVDDLLLDLDASKKLVLAWQPVAGAAHYALQVSRNHLFVDNVIDAENRTKTRATLGLRGEGSFQWRVAAFGSDGLQGPWSEPRKFRVASAVHNGGGEKQDAAPPELDLGDIKTYGSISMVNGRTEPGARVEVNGEQVTLGADGSFTKAVQLNKEGWNIIEVRARNAWGNETVRRHRVFVESP
ncbi:MAG TPA: FecR domain-containing protein [Thermoanaerobaculia bacterium]